MYNFIIKASWPESGDDIRTLIEPFGTDQNFAILYNNDPEVNQVYIATMDRRMILALDDQFEISEVESIDWIRDPALTSNRQWGVIGERSLVNF